MSKAKLTIKEYFIEIQMIIIYDLFSLFFQEFIRDTKERYRSIVNK